MIKFSLLYLLKEEEEEAGSMPTEQLRGPGGAHTRITIHRQSPYEGRHLTHGGSP